MSDMSTSFLKAFFFFTKGIFARICRVYYITSHALKLSSSILSLQPPTPSFPRGRASSPAHRTFQCPCTRTPSWSAWPQAIPGPSSPGAERTASLLMFTTPKCWETGTSLSPTSSPSMEGSICAEPPLPAREIILLLLPMSPC